MEASTDLGERDIVAALGDDADELFTILEPMAKAIVAGGGYPSRSQPNSPGNNARDRNSWL